MGMRQKLEKAYKEGFEAGASDALANVEKTNFVQTQWVKGYWEGTRETFDMIDQLTEKVPGIGPKTMQKILAALKEEANKKARQRGVNFDKAAGNH